MLEDIPNLGHSDPKISKSAALNVIKHVSKNKGELPYLIKRLVSGLEAQKISTRKGCYTTLTVLLALQKIDPTELFELMQKSLITNKQNSKKERRLIFTARILCTGAIISITPVATLSEDMDFLRAAIHDLVDLSIKRSGYFLLALPFLTRILSDDGMTQEIFDGLWETLAKLWEDNKQKQRNDDDEEQDDNEETCTANQFACRVQLALVCRPFRSDGFECLNDAAKICKSLLASQLQFPDVFLAKLFDFLRTSDEEYQQSFFTTLLTSIKPTQFKLLCLCVEKAIECKVQRSILISKNLVSMLVGVFKLSHPEFTAKSKNVIKLLLNLDDVTKKKQRKSILTCLFSGDPPHILHEYKVLHPLVRTLMFKLDQNDLDHLHKLITEQIDSKLSLRMGIVYLQFIGKIAACSKVSDETCFEICKKLLSVALGQETLDLNEEEEDAKEHIKKCASETLRSSLSNLYKFSMMDMLGQHLAGNFKSLATKEDSIKLIKEVKSVQKKVENPHLKYVLWAYSVVLLLDESEVLSTSSDGLRSLIEIARNKDGNVVVELIKFTLDNVLKEANPGFSYEEMFKKLMLEGKVNEEVIQVFADVMDVGETNDGDDNDEGEDDSEEDASDEGDDDDDDEPENKKMKLDPSKLAMLQEKFGAKSDDDEESIDLEDATDQDLKQMDGALAKVFAVQKSVKEEAKRDDRSLMRTLRLVETYVSRNIKSMNVSSLLMLLMPTVQLLRASLKMKKKNQQVTTRTIAVLDNLNRVKKFTGCDAVVEGTFASIAEELYEMSSIKSLSLFRELLEHSVVLVTKCCLQRGKPSKKEGKRLIKIYYDAVDKSSSKIKKRRTNMDKKRKKKQEANGKAHDTSRFVRFALESFEGIWKDGVKLINQRVEQHMNGVGE